MKIKTCELIRPALDWAVAVAMKHAVTVLTVAEHEARWFEGVAPEKLEKERADFNTYIRPTLKPEIRVLGSEDFKRMPTHEEAPMRYGEGRPCFQYSTSWLQGGPIIEQEQIELHTCPALKPADFWRAQSAFLPEPFAAYGPTPLVAAMRCFVASKLGDEVDVPEELMA